MLIVGFVLPSLILITIGPLSLLVMLEHSKDLFVVTGLAVGLSGLH